MVAFKIKRALLKLKPLRVAMQLQFSTTAAPDWLERKVEQAQTIGSPQYNFSI